MTPFLHARHPIMCVGPPVHVRNSIRRASSSSSSSCPPSPFKGPRLRTQRLILAHQTPQPLRRPQQNRRLAQPPVPHARHQVQQIIKPLLDERPALLLVQDVVAPLLLLRQLLAPRADRRQRRLALVHRRPEVLPRQGPPRRRHALGVEGARPRPEHRPRRAGHLVAVAKRQRCEAGVLALPRRAGLGFHVVARGGARRVEARVAAELYGALFVHGSSARWLPRAPGPVCKDVFVDVVVVAVAEEVLAEIDRRLVAEVADGQGPRLASLAAP